MARRSPPSDPARGRQPSGAAPLGYLVQSRRPLQILIFLLPLIIAYELALLFVLGDPIGPDGDVASGTVTVAAHRAILRLLLEMGFPPTAVLSLGGVVLVVLLLSWHVLRRDPWRIDGTALVGMTAESILLAIPLLAVAMLLSDPGLLAAAPATVDPAAAGAAAGAAGSGGAPGAPGAGGEGVPMLGLGGSLAISIGAGLYEELFFRWMLIAVLHTLLVDVAHLEDRLGTIISVIASAAAFTLYHDLSAVGGGIHWNRAVFLAIAGLYFGAVYAVRGFGIVVGLHAIYDIVTVLLDGPVPIDG